MKHNLPNTNDKGTYIKSHAYGSIKMYAKVSIVFKRDRDDFISKVLGDSFNGYYLSIPIVHTGSWGTYLFSEIPSGSILEPVHL